MEKKNLKLVDVSKKLLSIICYIINSTLSSLRKTSEKSQMYPKSNSSNDRTKSVRIPVIKFAGFSTVTSNFQGSIQITNNPRHVLIYLARSFFLSLFCSTLILPKFLVATILCGPLCRWCEWNCSPSQALTYRQASLFPENLFASAGTFWGVGSVTGQCNG